MRTLTAALVVSLSLIGCNYGKRNVQACEDWAEDMDAKFAGTECEGTDFAAALAGGCERFEENKCDISDYFTCLEDQAECNAESGEPNVAGWDACLDDATCE